MATTHRPNDPSHLSPCTLCAWTRSNAAVRLRHNLLAPRVHSKHACACAPVPQAVLLVLLLLLQMLDEAGPEHLADVLGPDNMAELLKDILKLGVWVWCCKQARALQGLHILASHWATPALSSEL